MSKFKELEKTLRCPDCGNRLRLHQPQWKDKKLRRRWLYCNHCKFELIEK